MTGGDQLHAEQRARALIDTQLESAGWLVQDQGALNLFAGLGVAVREVIMETTDVTKEVMAGKNDIAIDLKP